MTNDGAQSGSRDHFTSVVDPASDPHINGEYFSKNPTWHIEFSPWKADNIHQFLERRNLHPKTFCEVGCGAGEVLRLLQQKRGPECTFWGCDVAPPAIEMAKKNENDRLHFEVADFGTLDTPHFDLLLALEVVDHVEDYLGFLRMLKSRAEWKLFSFSLDLSAQMILRKGALTRRREVHSHVHHFSKESALGALKHSGYEIVDFCYPSSPLAKTTLAKLAKPIRTLGFKLAEDLTVRLFGGYSLLVLAR